MDLLLQKLINLARKNIVHDRQKTEGIVTVRKYSCEIPDTLEERLHLLSIGKAQVIDQGHNVITQGDNGKRRLDVLNHRPAAWR